MRRASFLLLAVSFLLSGCSGWMDGSYHSRSLYREQGYSQGQQIVAVSDYAGLRDALTDMVETGVENATIAVGSLDKDFIATNMEIAIQYAMGTNPIGAYAVEDITYEQGTSGGTQAVAVTISYNFNRSEIRRIRRYTGMEDAWTAVTKALDDCSDSLVLRIDGFEDVDYPQLIRDYADENPRRVMEMPQITVSTYPERGSSRVVVLQFTYQNARDKLQDMQEYVTPVFSAARLYVLGDTEASVKYAQLYAFLMERYNYTIQTSITPAYSLLRYGVGDSKAFAQVYAAMCRDASLECLVVSGTYNGEARLWNMICVDETYYHVDLLACNEKGRFETRMDEDMTGYVWDYSAYPQSVKAPE